MFKDIYLSELSNEKTITSKHIFTSFGNKKSASLSEITRHKEKIVCPKRLDKFSSVLLYICSLLPH